jgi:hypothetical protein
MERKSMAGKIIYPVGIALVLLFIGIRYLKQSICQSGFCTELNGKRRELHISILPSGWQLYHKDDNYTIWWVPKVKKGHGFKQIVYDGCELDLEEDQYYFSSKKLQDTIITIDYKYINSHRSKDSTLFTFQEGNHTDTISSKQADSIFSANKINKDY